MWNRRKIRRIRLDQQLVDGALDCCLLDIGSRRKRHDAAKRQPRSTLHTSSSLVRAAGETVKDGVVGNTFGVENLERLVPRLASMNHQWQFVPVGE